MEEPILNAHNKQEWEPAHTTEHILNRCRWCNLANPLYLDYHDNEWGVPVHDDGKLFEMLVLEGFQAGLSWECILNKRVAFRDAFDGFDVHKVAGYGDEKIESLMQNPGIVRNRLKIHSAVTNAAVFMTIQEEFGSFDSYLRTFTKGETVYEYDKATSPLSDAISKDLRKRGMKFVGSKIIYAYLQAIGVVNSHETGCFLYRRKP